MKRDIYEKILHEKIILIVRGVPREQLLPFCQAVYDGGIRLLELTYTPGTPDQDALNAENIRLLKENCSTSMTIGAGTVLTENQVRMTKEAGGEFIISPHVDEAVIRATKKYGMISIPGAMTPTEIVQAYRSGGDFVKLFPASVLGAEYFKAVLTPLSHIPVLAVAGISTENMAAFFAAGACGIGVSSPIANQKLLADCNYEGIRSAAKRYVDAVQRCCKA